MYHYHLQPSVSSSTSSSYTSRMFLLDHEDTRDSIFIHKAKKRRESIGEVVVPRKFSYSTSIMPRRTQSSILQPTTKRGVHWDPHIDSFEIITAKITGITRSMQQFHVQELLNPKATYSSPLSALSKSCQSHRRIRSHSYIIPKWQDEEEEKLSKSPNLMSLFLTTNELISSRLDELSEPPEDWQQSFLKLVTSCIQQSEDLESLSTDVLQTEHRLRELLLINDSLDEQFQEREKQYEERIRECQEIAQQQLIMIDSLEELCKDIDMKLETRRRRQLSYNQKEIDERWNFKKSVADLLNMEEKLETVQKMRWEIGMFVGGGVGTGHIIHTFQNKLNGIDMMIAGTGTTTSSSPPPTYETQSVSPSIHHIKLYQHHFLLHLNNRDRQTRFALLPKCLWVPDTETNQCQFHRCTTRFSFFRRKHHCRKCGFILCQTHSANRLPLFNPSKPTFGRWSRVCDTCFFDLIMQ